MSHSTKAMDDDHYPNLLGLTPTISRYLKAGILVIEDLKRSPNDISHLIARLQSLDASIGHRYGDNDGYGAIELLTILSRLKGDGVILRQLTPSMDRGMMLQYPVGNTDCLDVPQYLRDANHHAHWDQVAALVSNVTGLPIDRSNLHNLWDYIGRTDELAGLVLRYGLDKTMSADHVSVEFVDIDKPEDLRVNTRAGHVIVGVVANPFAPGEEAFLAFYTPTRNIQPAGHPLQYISRADLGDKVRAIVGSHNIQTLHEVGTDQVRLVGYHGGKIKEVRLVE